MPSIIQRMGEAASVLCGLMNQPHNY